MNILEHYIEAVHSVIDVTEQFEKSQGYPPLEQLFKVDLTYDCYGLIKRETRFFSKTEWEDAQKKGYFLA